MKRGVLTSALAGAIAAGLGAPALAGATAPAPAAEEMWRIIQEQQRQIEALKSRLEETDVKIEATAEAVEAGFKDTGAPAGGGWWERTTIGGYGELHYNGGDKDEVDFHRFVLFINHKFNERIRLFSELELEHALSGEGKEGEVELEQAYIDFAIDERTNAKAGVILVPVGILNETHEPPTFYGVERNPVETNIIPTTWWEAGLMGSMRLPHGFSGDVFLSSAFQVPTTGPNAFKVRNGRQKVSEATAKSPAITSRLRWTGMPGVTWSVTGQYQTDVTQEALDTNGALIESNLDIRRGRWGLRALVARWDLDGVAAEAIGRDVQWGWYVEPSYRFPTSLGDVGLFARYNRWDNEAGDNVDSWREQIDIGANYWPHENVVLKVDYQFQDFDQGGEDDRVNLGIGFQY